jgi:hypothetical protein
MKASAFFLVLIVLTTIYSCGQSAEEKAAMQKRRDDSIAVVSANMQRQRDNDIANAEKKKMQIKAQLQNKIAAIKNALQNAKADLAVANADMQKIQEFHIGRLQSDKDNQIRNQSLKTQKLIDNIDELKKALGETETNLVSYQ